MNLKKICKNCKHWKPTSLFSHHGEEYKITAGNFQVGECRCPKFFYFNTTESFKYPDGLGYGDLEQYYAYFYTGENFGCIHWTPKEIENEKEKKKE